MPSLESVLWWLASALVLFLVLYPTSRVWAHRVPRLFQALWLVFFLKLLVPVGLWSPLPPTQALVVPPASASQVESAVGAAPAGTRDEVLLTNSSRPVTSATVSAFETPWLLWVGGLWLMGTLAVAYLTLRAYRSVRRRSDLGPRAVGLFRPRVVLPADFEHQFTVLERDLVLAHEQAHLRVGDPFWLAVVQTLVCLFWWFPVVWWARREFQTVTELACDQAVLGSRPANEARVYGQLLVRLATRAGADVGVAFAGTFGGLRRRLSAVVRPLPIRGVWVVVLTLVVATGLGALSLAPLESPWAWPLPQGVEEYQCLVPLASANPPAADGLVIGVKVGIPVSAAADGTVSLLSEDAQRGWTVTLDHGNGYLSRYGNLELQTDPEPVLLVGQTVKRGQLLGLVFRPKFGYTLPYPVLPDFRFSVEKDGKVVDSASLFPIVQQLVNPTFLGRTLTWPLPQGVGQLATGFGMDIHPFTGQFYFHRGVDWRVATGTEVRVVADGTVAQVQFEALGYGWYIDVDHGNGRMSRYAHLQSIAATAEKGVSVVAGQVIGLAGESGLAADPALHWELIVDGHNIDPLRVDFAR